MRGALGGALTESGRFIGIDGWFSDTASLEPLEVAVVRDDCIVQILRMRKVCGKRSGVGLRSQCE